MTYEPKLCRDCKWIVPKVRERPLGAFRLRYVEVQDKSFEFAKCGRTDLIGGVSDGASGYYCSTERSDPSSIMACGPQGKFFEPREK